jgi:hypothetical protein
MMRLLLLLCLIMPFTGFAQPRTDSFMKRLLLQSNNPILKQVLSDPQTYRVQVIYTQIDRDKKNKPSFKNYYFHYDPELYFNPASMVKLPLALLSLEKINNLRRKGVNMFSVMQFDSSYRGQKPLVTDTTEFHGNASLAHFIRRAFLVSENDPYNRMYQFVGQRDINRRLIKKGYGSVRITRQFAPFDEDQNRHTPAISFYYWKGDFKYRQPPAYNRDSFHWPAPILIGKGHLNRNDSLVQAPMDFTRHNAISLGDLQRMLQATLFPASVRKQERFGGDHSFLKRYLSQFPSETDNPKYDTAKFYDSYVKFFFRDSTRKLPPGVRVFNKVGWSYGFLTDVSYVIDTLHKVEYMLAATVYVNSDGILNDGKYEYNSIGYPFLRALGEEVYQYELQRPRKYLPDLKDIIIPYDRRDPANKHPVLKEVDN